MMFLHLHFHHMMVPYYFYVTGNLLAMSPLVAGQKQQQCAVCNPASSRHVSVKAVWWVAAVSGGEELWNKMRQLSNGSRRRES